MSSGPPKLASTNDEPAEKRMARRNESNHQKGTTPCAEVKPLASRLVSFSELFPCHICNNDIPRTEKTKHVIDLHSQCAINLQ